MGSEMESHRLALVPGSAAHPVHPVNPVSTSALAGLASARLPLKAPAGLSDDHRAASIDSLKALATRNLTTFLAGIGTGWRVLGLRPMRALRATSTNLPMPGSVKVCLVCL